MPGRILIADALPTNRILLRTRLGAAHYGITLVGSGQDVRASLESALPDLLILDESLPDIGGIELCRELKEMPRTTDMPIVLLTGGDADGPGVAALHAGADEFLRKPVDGVALMARVRSLMRARETHDAMNRRRVTVADLGFSEAAAGFAPPARIVFVPHRMHDGIAWRDTLRGLVRDRIAVLTPDQALDVGDTAEQADLFVIAADLGQPRDGLQLLCDLRSRNSTRHAAIIILHRRGDSETAAMALDLGANDIVADGFPPAELAIRIRTQLRRKADADRLRSSVEDGLRLAVTDPLTGLYNRRYAMTHLGRIAERAARNGRPWAVMVADLDRFKQINDTWGHAAGDAVLSEVSRRLRDRLRDVDLVARIGGEEFLVAMPDMDADAAGQAAERLRRAVAADPVPLPGGAKVRATVSIGVAICHPAPDTPEPIATTVERADRALYAAKTEGRNQVTLSRPAASPSGTASQRPVQPVGIVPPGFGTHGF